MGDSSTELEQFFNTSAEPLPADITQELEAIQRLHDLSAQELFFKWESYSMKMGGENTNLDLKTARDFRKSLQDLIEREAHEKAHLRSAKRAGVPTPRTSTGGGSDVYGMLDGIVPNTPGSKGPPSSKRKSDFATPAAKAARSNIKSSPTDGRTPHETNIEFAQRQNPGKVEERLNEHLPGVPPHPIGASEPRVKVKPATDIAKFAYKPMAVKLSDASETLDDRIDDFIALFQETEHDLPLANAASQSPHEIIAIGRIACDIIEGRLSTASIVLETSRRTGAGIRVPLNLDDVAHYDFFPGQIVALRGSNPTGDQFRVQEVLSTPLLPMPMTESSVLEAQTQRLASLTSSDDDAPPLTILAACGPYTTDNDLSFAAFSELCEQAVATSADCLVLTGPFIDADHPLIARGDFSLPDTFPVAPDRATLTDLFRYHFSLPLASLVQKLPNLAIVMIPSVRDAVSTHVSWPQDRLPRKDLQLPRNVNCGTNPYTAALNEVIWGLSSHDVLSELRGGELVSAKTKAQDPDILNRLSAMLMQQRHYMPVYPPASRPTLPAIAGEDEGAEAEERRATGVSLDLGYLKLGDFGQVRPDVLVLPSVLSPFVKVIDSVLVLNPGTLSKRRGPGTYARMSISPLSSDDNEGLRAHQLYERARVEIVRI